VPTFSFWQMPKKTHIIQGFKTSYSHLILFHQDHFPGLLIVFGVQTVEIQAG
jgi:hypothetical protein